MQHRFRLNAIASLFTTLAPAAYAAADTAPPLDVVVVSGSRVEHSAFELPASVDVLDGARIHDGQIRVNASEALAAVPGLVAQNRQNYAQDLQISSRGFGARSAFGVRGVRLISDGIPASMPDGQGQAATFNLDMAERIEVLRGPFSALYGNHSGGVIQMFTKDGQGAPTLELGVVGGSDGARKTDLNAQGQAGALGYVLDGSQFRTAGYRKHSAATREQRFAKLTLAPGADSKLTVVASGLRQDGTQDPLGVLWSTLQRDPRAGEIDPNDPQTPKRSFAERYDTRKNIEHQQLGASYERRFGDERLRLSVYGGNRRVTQYQAFSKAFQAPASHSGGVVDFKRDFYGADLQWQSVRPLAGGKLSTTVGLEYGRSGDDRQGFENFIGSRFGVKGKLRRDERDIVSNVDPYVQTEWQAGAWLLSAGLRHNKTDVDVQDRFLGNGNDSGSLSFSHTTPVLGVLYKVTPALNLYASAARGFETPTLNELFYSGAGGGFNFHLQAATGKHLEVGAKALLGGHTRVNAAVFEVRTSDELVVDAAAGGRTSYRNAGETLRQGVEVSLDSAWGHGLGTRLALTGLRAVYDQAFANVAAGSRLPGVPNANLYGEVAWTAAGGRYGAALETLASGKAYAEDSNVEKAAPGYALLNLRLNARQSWANWGFKEFVRVNNLADRKYVGSLIVGDNNKRYYEGAPGRNWLLGASAQYAF
ncbi:MULTISPECIES: TonB-dependent receptor family protein [unclassified Janthinobacterium]|uniref:TonB-dependent receptor family protein n=1 Tax=unclassified Janthinobacterium TaxID=2610881 RepID=UPI00034569D5|nr:MULTISPECIES: TonB-dependent receptor [unclassified Janthinobacterium]MEC5164185.1 iron complex outermembrane receptor protein [Janthinobacterium sp. CG_S6]